MSTESIYCRCGAAWHGQYTKSTMIQHHIDNPSCKLISHDEYLTLMTDRLRPKRFRCGCPDCRAARKRKP